MKVTIANIEDADQILSLQKLAYQSEAELYNDFNMPPLVQTIEEIKKEFDDQIFLKVVDVKEIIGSVRAYSKDHTCFIGRLIVHPEWQGNGLELN